MQKNTKLIAVVTPTYNRAKLLPRLFESLVSQSEHDFKWYIVDDGSVDDTEKVVKSFKTKVFEIEYIKQENGGKHTALNRAMSAIKEKLTFIVDSDDWLTSNAIETIKNDYPKISNDDRICGLGYLRCFNNMQTIGMQYTENGIVESFIEQRINKNTFGDKAEVYKTEILKQYPFPVFEGENFVSESTVWCDIALTYNLMFFNKNIYVCEYQEGGLSDGVHKRLFKNPQGAAACYLKMTSEPFKFRYKFKYTVAFSTYAYAAKIKFKDQLKMANSKRLLACIAFPAFILFKLKQRKFK